MKVRAMTDLGRSAAQALRLAIVTLTVTLLARAAFASIPTPPPPTPTPPPAMCVAPFSTPRAVCCFACPVTHTCVTSRGGPGCFDVSAPAGCCWSAFAAPGFGLTVTEGAEGCGDGRVCYDVPPYIGDLGRVLQVQVGDKEYLIGQSRPGTVTATPTVTPTPPVTTTPTCAATGTPYCTAECRPCTEIRPGCLKFACGRCFENPRCDANEACVPPGPIAAGGCCACATVTPTGSPCVQYEEEQLTFDLDIEPPAPRVGDEVTLTFLVRNTTSGLAGIPAYHLHMTPALFSGTPVPTTTGATSLGMETVTFRLRAAQAGASSIQLSVDYETERGCVGDPVFFFRAAESQMFPIAVAAAAMHRVAGHLSSDLFCTSDAAGVAVTLQPTTRATLTAADGTFAFEDVADGDYVLQIEPGNYTLPVTVAGGQNVQIEFCIGCANALAISPIQGPVGTVVTAQGTCYALHSGRLVTVFFDDGAVAETRGDTSGSFSTTFTVPLNAAIGSHLVRLFGPGTPEIASALFIVGSGTPLCRGDCDDDHQVTVDELIRGVAMALGTPDVTCPAFGSDGVVTIAELVAAVDRALNGCASS